MIWRRLNCDLEVTTPRSYSQNVDNFEGDSSAVGPRITSGAKNPTHQGERRRVALLITAPVLLYLPQWRPAQRDPDIVDDIFIPIGIKVRPADIHGLVPEAASTAEVP